MSKKFRIRPILVGGLLLGGVVLFLFVVCTGGVLLSTSARETFAQRYSCPEDRITVRERGDVRPSQIFLDPATPESPPDEVARDPGRLARWRSDRAKARQQSIDSYDDRFNYSITVYEVDGCGHTVFMGCEHTMYVGENDCDEGHPPGGVSQDSDRKPGSDRDPLL